jgi:hypothetical protein
MTLLYVPNPYPLPSPKSETHTTYVTRAIDLDKISHAKANYCDFDDLLQPQAKNPGQFKFPI